MHAFTHTYINGKYGCYFFRDSLRIINSTYILKLLTSISMAIMWTKVFFSLSFLCPVRSCAQYIDVRNGYLISILNSQTYGK